MSRVLIMRGIPGSGKTTEAKRWQRMVPGAVICSMDNYMFANGQEFAFDRIEWCAEQCIRDYTQALKDRAPLVIVDNTNTRFSDMVVYVQLADQHGYGFTVLQVHVDPKVAFYRGTHKVPLESLETGGRRMWSERLPSS